jgi:hypothetical protein
MFLILSLTFPNNEYLPTQPQQFILLTFVTYNVSVEFGDPEFLSSLWKASRRAAGMTMPKTSMYKNHNSARAEN